METTLTVTNMLLFAAITIAQHFSTNVKVETMVIQFLSFGELTDNIIKEFPKSKEVVRIL